MHRYCVYIRVFCGEEVDESQIGEFTYRVCRSAWECGETCTTGDTDDARCAGSLFLGGAELGEERAGDEHCAADIGFEVVPPEGEVGGGEGLVVGGVGACIVDQCVHLWVFRRNGLEGVED